MQLEPLKDEIIDMYTNQNLDSVQISEIIGCSSSSVLRLLESNGIKRVHHARDLRFTQDEIDKMSDMYINGMTTREIGRLYGICDNSVSKLLKNNGVEIRRAVRRSKIKNHRYFQNIDTPQKAYFLGWMISDGSVVTSRTRPDRAPIISIEVHNRDRCILERFAEELGADDTVVHLHEKRNHAHLRFASEEMASDLAQYGVVPNKTWTMYLPIIDEALMPHLIRGYFDGNGTVTVNKKDGTRRFAFYGSEEICTNIRDYLHNTIGINKNKVSKSTCYHVWWGGKSPSKLFYEYIYNDCDDLKLDRKKIKFEAA